MADFLAARGFAVLEHELDMLRDAAGEAPRLRDVAIREVGDPAPMAAALAALHNRAHAGDPSFAPLDAAGMTSLLAGAVLLAAEMRGHAIGFCHVELGQRESWIENLVVAPDRQGHGVGTALVAAALDLAARRGGGRMRLSVSDRNAPAYVVYRRLGFAVIAKSARYRADRAAVLAALGRMV
jgi:ribosomal protein S18 acetylase RimI-like enzyme